MTDRIIRQSFRSGRSGTRRLTEWDPSSVPAGVNSLASGTIALDQGLVALNPLTVVRVRGYLFVQSDQVAAREEAFGAFGLTVVNTRAFSVGVTACPAPLTNQGEPGSWQTWVPYACQRNADTGGENVYSAPFDSKAMRKMEVDDVLVAMIENSASGFGVEYEFWFNVLVKLA